MFGVGVNPSDARNVGRYTPFESGLISQKGEKCKPCGKSPKSGCQSIFAIKPSGDFARSATLPYTDLSRYFDEIPGLPSSPTSG